MIINYLSNMVLKQKLFKIIKNVNINREIVFFFIGNSKISFDAFGSDVFFRLKHLQRRSKRRIICVNVKYKFDEIYSLYNKIKNKYNNPYIIAVDACLTMQNLPFGTIIIKNVGLIPKSGFYQFKLKNQANLTDYLIGDASITCVLTKMQKTNILLKKNANCKNNLILKREGIFAKLIVKQPQYKLSVANAWVQNESSKRVANFICDL